MTEKIYYNNNKMTEFEAHILEQSKTTKGFRVVLDRTAFYPEGGGQSSDRGWIDDIPVTYVSKEGDTIVHYTKKKSEKEYITGRIDWPHRFRTMQQHTGQHIISAAFWKIGNFKTLSVHMGENYTTIEFDVDLITEETLREGECLANQIVGKNYPVTAEWVAHKALDNYDLRKPTDIHNNLRLVLIKDFDTVACGGIHCSSTGEVGLIKIIGQETIRGNIRIIFKIGSDAYEDYESKIKLMQGLRAKLSTSDENVLKRIDKINQELIELKQLKNQLIYRLTDYMSKEILSRSVHLSNSSNLLVTEIFKDEVDFLIKAIIKELLHRQNAVGLIINVKGKQFLWHIISSDLFDFPFSEMKNRLFEKYQMKGGGSFPHWQGMGLDYRRIAQLISDFKKVVIELTRKE